MKKQLSLLSILTCFVLLSCEQHQEKNIHSSKNDSIEKYIKLASNSSFSIEKRIQYNDKAYSFIDFKKNDSLNRSFLYNYTIQLYNLKKKKDLLLNANKLIILSEKSNDSLHLASGYRALGLYYMISNNNEKAITSLFKARKIAHTLNNKNTFYLIEYDISTILSYTGDFLGSNKILFEILKKNKLDKDHIFYCNIGIADNLSYLKQYNKSIEYYKKSNFQNRDSSSRAIINNSILSSYLELNDFENAIIYINKNLNNKELFKSNPKTFSTTESLLGLYYLKQNKFEKLPYLFLKAEKKLSQLNSLHARNYNQMYLSEYYAKVKDTLNAIKAAQNAVTISKSYKNPNDILLTLKQLIKVDKKNASINGQEYIRLNDSLQIAERSFRDKFARIQFETDEITKEKDIAVQHKQNVITGASILLILGILFFIIYRQRTAKKKLLLEQSNQKINEEIYQLMLSQKNNEEAITQKEKKRIALELHDGVMNKLASTRLNLFVLSKKNDPETIKKCISHIAEIQSIEQEIRNIAHDLNNEIFKTENSFIQMLKDLIQNKESNSLTQYEIEIDKTIPWEKISSEIKMNLYRILQEAIHNIEKHANAKKATISFIKDQNNIGMSVSDNGTGFDTQKKKNGIGIQNMLYRVKNLNGKISINSFPNSNTSINISIPIS